MLDIIRTNSVTKIISYGMTAKLFWGGTVLLAPCFLRLVVAICMHACMRIEEKIMIQ